MNKTVQNKKKRVPRIGIPRALYYYIYYPMWSTFFKEIGCKVVVSSPTSKTIKDLGVRHAPDEDCYNTKLYYGHVISLKDKVDYYFIPRLGSDHPVHVGCPKFISLADVIRSMYPELPEIIRPYYSQAKSHHGPLRFFFICLSIGFRFTKNPVKIIRAMNKAVRAEKEFKQSLTVSLEKLKLWETGKLEINAPPEIKEGEPVVKVALAAHSYILNDPYASINIRDKLQKHGVSLITSQQLPRSLVKEQMDRLDYNFYFEYEREILGTILYFLQHKTADGIIHINTFCCGPDSIAGEMASQYSKKEPEVPLLQLTFDELTGEAGLNTRIEAFIDMLKRRQLKYLSPTPTLDH